MALTTIRDLIEALRAGRSSIAPIVTANKAIRDNFVAERDVLTGELAALDAARDIIVADTQSLRDELPALIAARDAARDTLTTDQAALNVLNQELAAIDPLDTVAIAAKEAEITAQTSVVSASQGALDSAVAAIDAKRGEIAAKVAEREAKVDEITAKRSEIAAKKTELSIAQGDLKEAQAYRRTVSDMLQSLRDAGGLDPADTATEVQDAYDAVTAMMAAEGLWDAGDFQSYTVLILQKRGELPLGTVTDALLQALLEDTAKTVAHAEDSVKEWCCDQLAHVYDVHLEERPSEVAMKAAITELESGNTTFTEFGTAIAAIRSGQGKIR